MSSSMDTDDPRHSFNLPKSKKRLILVIGLICIFNSTLGSSLPSGATASLAQHFGLSKSSDSLVLLNSLYMVGFTISPLLFAPLSESIGRRPVLVSSYTIYTVFMMCCAVAPTYTVLLVFRFFTGMCAAVPNTVVGALYVDVFDGPKARGRAMALFMYTAVQAPLVGPLISGFISTKLGWRWTFWVGLILAGGGLPVVWALPETCVPVLTRQAEERTKEIRIDRSTVSIHLKALGRLLKRPGHMMVQEPILLFTSLYLALVYAIMYLFFQAYPIIFGGIYGLSEDMIGLAYIPIMAGTTVSLVLFHFFGILHARAEVKNRSWANVEEYRRLPLACFGGPFIPISLLILSFTATVKIHPAVAMVVSGFLFGTGYLMIFLAMLIYLSDIYKRYAASAQAVASITRSIAAVCLPFATPMVYRKLGVHGAGVLLACASGVAVTIPFVFMFLKTRPRDNSVFSG